MAYFSRKSLSRTVLLFLCVYFASGSATDDSVTVGVTPPAPSRSPGQNITFSCSLNNEEGSSTSNFSWYFVMWLDYKKEMDVIDVVDSSTSVDNLPSLAVNYSLPNEKNLTSNLTISSVSVEHAGAFYCFARHVAKKPPPWNWAVLTVNNPAKSAVISYNDVDFAAGKPQSNLTITCKGSGESGPPRLLNLTVTGLKPSGLEPSGPVEIGEPTVVSDETNTNSATASVLWEDLKGWNTVNISCTVWGDYSLKSETDSTLVAVTELPKVVFPKGPAVELEGSVGQNLTLNCSGSGRPKPTLSWTHGDKAVNCSEAGKYSCKPADPQNGPSLNLTILTMEEADFGLYTCTVKSDLAKEGVSAVYNVTKKTNNPVVGNADNDTPDDSKEKDPAIVGADDENLDYVSLEEGFCDTPRVIKCIGSDGSDAGWNPDDIRSPIKLIKEGVLEISEVSLSNSGTYRCCLKDVDDKYVVNCSSLELTVTNMTITSPIDNAGKTKSGKILHFDVKNNDQIGTFTCNSKNARIEWFKIDESNPPQQLTDFKDMDASSLLKFNGTAAMADSGTYKCCSKLDDEKKYCAVLDLIVHDDSTKVVVAPETPKLIPGENITFSCSVNKKDERSSNTTFSWFFVKWRDYSEGMELYEVYTKGSQVKNDSSFMVSNGKSNEEKPLSTLTISSVSIEHAGAFFCVASRGDVSWRKFGLLAVNNPAKSAVISYNDVDFAAGMPQSDLTITCKGSGESRPPRLLNLTVTGLEPSGLEPSGPVEIGEPTVVSNGTNTNSATASIPWEDLKGWNTVNISCTVWGDYSPKFETDSTLVAVTDLPKVVTPKEPAVELEGSVGQSLTVSCSGSGRPKPTLSWTHGDKAVNCSEADKYSCKPADPQNGPSLNLTILMMEEADFGQYTCTVKSDLDKEGVSAVYNVTKKTSNPIVDNAGNGTTDNSSSDIIEVSAPSVSESTPSPSPSPTPSSPPLSNPVIAAAALVGLVIVIMGGLYLAYRYRYRIRDWIMSKEVSRSALRKAKYVRGGGGGVFKYARLPRDITEAMTHHD